LLPFFGSDRRIKGLYRKAEQPAAGGGIAILIAVLFLPAFYRYRRTRSAPAILPGYLDKAWAGWVIAAAYILMAIGSAVSIR